MPSEIHGLSADDGLTFLELLAHNLTIAVRMAAEDRQPYGRLTEEQTRAAMYWINEVLHNVVQLTRDLRLGREAWDAERIAGWVGLWLGYEHATKYNKWAVDRSIDQVIHPYKPNGS